MTAPYNHYVKSAANNWVSNLARNLGGSAGNFVYGANRLGSSVAQGTGALGSKALQGANRLGSSVAQGTGALGSQALQGTKNVGRFVTAPAAVSRARDVSLPAATRAGTTVKSLAKPVLTGATVNAAGGIAAKALGLNQDLSTRQNQIYSELTASGVPEQEAKDTAYKATYGLLGSTAGHVASNPYYYLVQGGGANPYDQGLSNMLGQMLPWDLGTALRQGGNILTRGPVGALGTAATSGVMNFADSIGMQAPAVVEQVQTNVENSPTAVPDLMESRYAQHLRDYLGSTAATLKAQYDSMPPEQRAQLQQAATERAQTLASPYAETGMTDQGQYILRPGPQVAPMLADAQTDLRNNFTYGLRNYAPTYLRRPLLASYDAARRAAENAPNPVAAAQAAGASMNRNYDRMQSEYADDVAADALGRYMQYSNALKQRGISLPSPTRLR